MEKLNKMYWKFLFSKNPPKDNVYWAYDDFQSCCESDVFNTRYLKSRNLYRWKLYTKSDNYPDDLLKMEEMINDKTNNLAMLNLKCSNSDIKSVAVEIMRGNEFYILEVNKDEVQNFIADNNIRNFRGWIREDNS